MPVDVLNIILIGISKLLSQDQLCIHFCKKGVLKISDKRNVKGYNVVEVFAPGKCKPCKLCEMNCPDFAVYVEAEKG